MAQPVWFSHDQPGFNLSGATVHANPGNWLQGQGGAPLVDPRYIFLWYEDGVRVVGVTPPPRSDPADHFPGEGVNSYQVTREGTHNVHFEVIAGNYYHNPPDPFIGYEWGRGHVTNVTEPYREPANGEITITVGPVPTPPAQPNIPAALTTYQNVVLSCRRSSNSYHKWKADSPAQASALEAYEAAVLTFTSPIATPKITSLIGESWCAEAQVIAWLRGVHD